ncbi:hypothetical protein DM860_012979 [Cuscuta australis]|uniref:RING-type domain-containing protein n=1 Tax=Cuscuta australis TaxID=267555 RepID=A0A328DW65_9ASTE|nr:hypothetical protein DM860_012979 [Cuscuta australis]
MDGALTAGGSGTEIGAPAPSEKSAPVIPRESPPPPPAAQGEGSSIPAPSMEELDKDVLCPICMQVVKDAFLTPCGHSFCYMCIVTHLKNKSDCPCCSHYLTKKQLYPNFLLNKLLMKTTAHHISKTALPVEQFCRAIQEGCKMSAKELDSLLSILSEKKKKAELEETEANLQLLFNFMQCLRKQKFDELHEIQNDLEYIKEDIRAVEKCRLELYRARDRCSAKTLILRGQSSQKGPVLCDQHSCGTIPNVPNAQGERLAVSNCPQARITQDPFPYQLIQTEDEHNGSVSEHNVARRRQVHAQFSDLQECYLQKRRHYGTKPQKREESVTTNRTKEQYNTGLEEFQYIFSAYTRYSRLQVVAEFRHTDLFHTVNIVSSIEFNRDDELFAIAGVSRRIKVFDFADVVNKPTGLQCPVVEMPTRSKLSCLSWNKYKKNYIASSDYEGIVTVWDVTTRQVIFLAFSILQNTSLRNCACITTINMLISLVRVLWSVRSMKNEHGVLTFHALNLLCWFLEVMIAR